ncbi:MAG: ribonucleoside triphosphate reductase [Patescibacteria group bacterium]
MAKIQEIKKRDGRIVIFEQERITNAIHRAIIAVNGRDGRAAKKISNEVIKVLERRFIKRIPRVEDIQDIVEEVLIKNNLYEIAKAYILYRKQHQEMREMESLFIDVGRVIDEYIGKLDWRVKENSNITYSLSGLLLYIAGSVISDYVLTRIYPREISEAHRQGDMHIHNLSFGVVGYCAGWSLKQLLYEGFGGVEGKASSKPAKHFDTALLQMSNFIGTLQNEWAGAMAFNSVDTLLAPLVRSDKLNYIEVKQAIQQLIFNLNTTSRWGGQTPFTNLSFDWTVPRDLKNEPVVVGGKLLDAKYGDYQKEMDMINRAFLEVMKEGDAQGRPFTFPIPTYNLTKDFDWDSKNADLLFEMTGKYGLPYFTNFINSDLDPSDVRSMCCHLQLRLDEIRRNITGGLFGSSDSTGSIGVVTINLPRLAYVAKKTAKGKNLEKTKKEFFLGLSYVMELAKNSLEIKREIVEKNIQNGLIPFSKRYLGTLKNHFSTIGLIGGHEACLNLLGKSISSTEGKKFAQEILNFMRDKIITFQKETGHLYNLEATPAEGTSYRLPHLDKKQYPDIVTSGEREPYYTQATCLPVNEADDLFGAIRHQEDLQSLYTGGTVFHVFLGERLIGAKSCKNLIKKLATNSKLPYFTITPTYSICPNHGYLSGEHFKCSTCQSVCEVYSRVVGYFRPVQVWNASKQEEFRQRKMFTPLEI